MLPFGLHCASCFLLILELLLPVLLVPLLPVLSNTAHAAEAGLHARTAGQYCMLIRQGSTACSCCRGSTGMLILQGQHCSVTSGGGDPALATYTYLDPPTLPLPAPASRLTT